MTLKQAEAAMGGPGDLVGQDGPVKTYRWVHYDQVAAKRGAGVRPVLSATYEAEFGADGKLTRFGRE